MGQKYTKAQLEEAARKSVSIAGTMRALGIDKWTGSQHALIRDRLREHKIDTSHFTGQGSNAGAAHRGGPEKSSWKEVLIKRTSKTREKPFRLRRALMEAGVPYACSAPGCVIVDTWNGRTLRLQVEHRNGDFSDCRKENLSFLCPNCHSQTDSSFGPEVSLTGVTSAAALHRQIRSRRRGGTLVDPHR